MYIYVCVYIFPLNSVSTLRGSYGKFFVAGGSINQGIQASWVWGSERIMTPFGNSWWTGAERSYQYDDYL